ncbi:MAG: polyisoprenoid-binding protein [Betaproteobacteria bacterium]|nr:polyisoprenoid-binding protein [Betaproteobacteria bacterium]
MKRIATLAIAATLSLPAFAAPETYGLDANHTFTSFSYSHFGYSIQQSRFDKTTGSVTIDRAAKTGSADITIDVKSVSTGSEAFNGHLKGDGFFDADKFPTATYKSTGFKFDGDKLASIDGNLTIKGVTKPATLTVTNFHCMPHPMSKKDACGANATTKIKRSDFNLGKYVPNVGDEVTITVAIEAVKQ